MWSFKHIPFRYTAIQESDNSIDVEQRNESKDKDQTKRPWYRTSIFFMCLICAIIGFMCGEITRDNRFIKFKGLIQFSKCTNPPTRREWRSLSTSEKDKYISAVRCLLSQPSKLRADGSLYNDFPYLHSQIGSFCKSLGFLYDRCGR